MARSIPGACKLEDVQSVIAINQVNQPLIVYENIVALRDILTSAGIGNEMADLFKLIGVGDVDKA